MRIRLNWFYSFLFLSVKYYLPKMYVVIYTNIFINYKKKYFELKEADEIAITTFTSLENNFLLSPGMFL